MKFKKTVLTDVLSALILSIVFWLILPDTRFMAIFLIYFLSVALYFPTTQRVRLLIEHFHPEEKPSPGPSTQPKHPSQHKLIRVKLYESPLSERIFSVGIDDFLRVSEAKQKAGDNTPVYFSDFMEYLPNDYYNM